MTRAHGERPRGLVTCALRHRECPTASAPAGRARQFMGRHRRDCGAAWLLLESADTHVREPVALRARHYDASARAEGTLPRLTSRPNPFLLNFPRQRVGCESAGHVGCRIASRLILPRSVPQAINDRRRGPHAPPYAPNEKPRGRQAISRGVGSGCTSSTTQTSMTLDAVCAPDREPIVAPAERNVSILVEAAGSPTISAPARVPCHGLKTRRRSDRIESHLVDENAHCAVPAGDTRCVAGSRSSRYRSQGTSVAAVPLRRPGSRQPRERCSRRPGRPQRLLCRRGLRRRVEIDRWRLQVQAGLRQGAGPVHRCPGNRSQ